MLNLVSRLIALCIMLSLFNSYTLVSFSASLRGAPAMMGALAVAGEVRVNGQKAFTGSTLFSESAIETGRASSALVNMEQNGQIELAGETALNLSLNDSGFSLRLDAGEARVAAPKGVEARVTAGDVSLASHAGEPALFRVQSVRGSFRVYVEAGKVEVRRGVSETTLITAGERYPSADDSAPQLSAGAQLSSRKKAGLILGIGGAVALIAIIIAGRDDDSKDACIQPVTVSDVTVNPCQ